MPISQYTHQVTDYLDAHILVFEPNEIVNSIPLLFAFIFFPVNQQTRQKQIGFLLGNWN